MNASDAFDAGVVALGQGDHATAIANLLTARAAAPRDREIDDALEAARAASGSLVHVEPPLPVAVTDIGLVLVLVNVALCVAIALRVKRSVLVACGAVWLLAAAAWVTRLATTPEYVVIKAADTKTYAANDSESLERYRLGRGDELTLLERHDGWLKVRGPEGPAYVAASAAIETTHLGGQGHR